MEKEGISWEKSKERREYERGKAERMQIVEMRKKALKDKVVKDKIQEKITESLARLPENRQRLLRMEEDKERRMLLTEAKKELWKRWRQKKGRGQRMKAPEPGELEGLEKKLKRIETEIAKYNEELEEKERLQKMRDDRKARKVAKEKHWEMMR